MGVCCLLGSPLAGLDFALLELSIARLRGLWRLLNL